MRLPNKKVLAELADSGISYTARFYYFLAPVVGYPDEVAIYRSPISSRISSSFSGVPLESDYVIVKRSFLERFRFTHTV